MIKIGILSFAHMHVWSYATCLKKLGAQIVGVYDDDKMRGKKGAGQFQAKYFADYKKLLSTDIQAVVVGSENSRHKELTVAAAQAGKHVLCEKPMATSIKDAREMIRACEANNVKLQIAFPCRYSPAARCVKQMLADNKLGKILAIKGTNHGRMPGGWFVEKGKSGGGAVIDHTVHVTDLMRWMLGKEVKRVYAEIDTRFHNLKIDDCAIITMDFDGGVFATLDPSWSRPNKSYPFWGDVTMKFIGTNGTLDLDLFNQKTTLYNEEQLKAAWTYWGDNIDFGLVKSFLDSIADNTPSPVSGYDGLKALEVAVAAYRSAKLKKPVEVPFK